MNFNIILLLFLLFISTFANANKVYERFPDEIDPSEKYVFYSHGKIVEGNNTNPIHSRWGEYQFPKIKKALSNDNHTLIAYHRPRNTNPHEFALKLSDDVKKLIAAGVKPENITLVGFSRGGEITILTSNYLKNPKVTSILLASCTRYMLNKGAYQMHGKVFSIYETSDGVGSCQFLIDQSPNVNSFSEVSISTGKEHGAFYRPLTEWLIPTLEWID